MWLSEENKVAYQELSDPCQSPLGGKLKAWPKVSQSYWLKHTALPALLGISLARTQTLAGEGRSPGLQL